MDSYDFSDCLGKKVNIYLKDGTTLTGIGYGYTLDDEDGDCLTVRTEYGLLYDADAPDIDHIEVLEV